MKKIIETASENPNFTTLVKAITAAELIETLSGVDPFTVFAPTNEAFRKVNEAKLTALLGDKAKLTSILTYHVVAGKLSSTDIAVATELKSLEGESLTVNATNGVTVNNAIVTKDGIECENGIIYAIDTVLML